MGPYLIKHKTTQKSVTKYELSR